MSLSRKLIIPFTVVIIFMVAGMAAYVFYWQTEEGKILASRKIISALNKLSADFAKIQIANRDFANRLSRDNTLIEALNKQDRSAISTLFKGASDARAFSGILTAYDENGKVVYSSDTPAKFGYGLRGKNTALDYVLNNQDNFTGATYGLTAAQSIALSALVPVLGSSGQCIGIVAVSEPIDEEFLTGESLKFALLSEPLSGIDLILLSVRDRNQMYITPGLLREKPPYLRLLSEQSVRALPNWQEPGSWQAGNMMSWFTNLFNKNGASTMGASFVKDNRFWQSYFLTTASRSASHNGTEIIGVILATTPLTNQGIKPGFVVLASCIMGLAAIFSIIALSTQLKVEPEGPVQTLIERVQKWRSDKHMPPSSKLSGAWRDLSEAIDQTLIEWQSTIQGLKVQLNKVNQSGAEGKSASEIQVNDAHFEALNKQLTNQSRQLSEFSRQLNHANQQAVFLQHELEAILQSTTEGILLLDQYGNIIHSNNVFLNWLGVTDAEIAGRFCLDLVKKNSGEANTESPTAPPGTPSASITPQSSILSASTSPQLSAPSASSQSSAVLSAFSGTSFVKHEANASALLNDFFPEGIVYHAPSGKAVQVSLNLQPVTAHDNRLSGYVLIARDKSLRSEISGLKMEIVTMLARAIRGPLMTAEKDWQNILASETAAELIKTPEEESNVAKPEEIHAQLNRELNQELTPPVLTFGQRLVNLHSRYNNLIASVESMLTTHGQSIGELIPLANESGAFSALDVENVLTNAEPLKESFSVSKLIGECLKEAANLAHEKQLLLDHKTSTALPNINGDRALMKSIISPIVDKLIAVTAPGGKVRVESSAKGQELQLSISSSGPALSEEETADIFAGFNQEKHTEDTYGSHLALYLARNNAERIGAKLWAQTETQETKEADESTGTTLSTSPATNEDTTSAPAQGTTVYILLPIV